MGVESGVLSLITYPVRVLRACFSTEIHQGPGGALPLQKALPF